MAGMYNGREVEDVCKTRHLSWLFFTWHCARRSISKLCRMDWYVLLQIGRLPRQIAIESRKCGRLAPPLQPKDGRARFSFAGASRSPLVILPLLQHEHSGASQVALEKFLGNVLWFVPISEEERQLAINQGSEWLKSRVPVDR